MSPARGKRVDAKPPRRYYHFEDLQLLHSGVDRGGVRRSWQEIADITGLSPIYVRNRLNGGAQYKLPHHETVIDPRDYEPELKAYLTDEQVAAWQADPRCLCGCEAVPKRETQKGGGMVPWGAYRLFVAGHYSRTPWMRERNAQNNADPEKRRRQSLTQIEGLVDTTILAGLVTDYLRDNHMEVRTLAEAAFMSHSHLSAIRCGKFPRVRAHTAGRLLAAMNEPMRPEIAAAYRKWMQDNKMMAKAVVVLP